ncbi:Maf family protein [Chromatiaceae bacterium AAb-1]|nr:Maf family protein [Chromatiaceae bacterium AAb-1]
MKYPEIALASSSPRRRELLTQLGVSFELVSIDVDETPFPAELPEHYVSRLAVAKAVAGAEKRHYAVPVLGADTIVVAAGQILGKPADQQDFNRMMSLLSGRCHQVMTAVAVVTATGCQSELVSTEVCFRVVTQAEADDYWQTGEPQDKAGGYGIQGSAARFIQRINGSYTAVVGLPLCETDALLRRLQD